MYVVTKKNGSGGYRLSDVCTNIEKAIKKAKEPGSQICPVCGNEFSSLMDKLSINLYNKCMIHIEEDSCEEKSILSIVEAIS